MKKSASFLLLIIFMTPATVRAGAVPDAVAGPSITLAQAGDKITSDINRSQKRQPGEPGAAGSTSLVRPVPIAPSDETVITDWNVVFSWKGAPGRSFYRLQVSARPSFVSTVLDAVIASKSYNAITALAPGAYFWRVKTMNAFKKSSIWSKVRRFSIPAMAPSNTTAGNFINKGQATTDSPDVSLALSAASSDAVTAYYVSENAAQPQPTAAGWTATTPSAFYASVIPYTLSSGDGAKTISVWFKDASERISPSATGTIILDTRPPVAMITSRPADPSDVGPAIFGFSSSKADATFQCELDSAGYSPCASPVTYQVLTEGTHVFSVKAVDAAKHGESPPASYTWAAVRPLVTSMSSDFINRKGNSYIVNTKIIMLSLSASATKEGKIVGYFASENPDTPDASDADWIAIKPVRELSKTVPFTLSEGSGTKTIYVWFKDTRDNVSEVTSSKITYFNSKYLLIAFLVVQAVLFL